MITAIKFNMPPAETLQIDENGNTTTAMACPGELICNEDGSTNCPDYTPIEQAIRAGEFAGCTETKYYANHIKATNGEIEIPVIEEKYLKYFEEYIRENPGKVITDNTPEP